MREGLYSTYPSVIVASCEDTLPVRIGIEGRFSNERGVRDGGEVVGPCRQHEVVEILKRVLS